MTGVPTHLRVEHLDEAFGITVRQPRFSWWLPAASAEQVAYRVKAGAWDSGRVESAQSVLVPYAGPALRSGEAIEWSVQVWTDQGESGWSAPASFEMGLLTPSDWQAAWIAPVEEEGLEPGRRPGYHLRGTVVVDRLPDRARAYATARGVYDLYVNGVRVGDQELTPGATAYRSILQFQTYDVTPYLVAGENVVEAVLTDGWWRSCLNLERSPDNFGTETAFLLQLDVDGTVSGTDASWQSAPGAIVGADMVKGEIVDFNRQPTDWRPVRVVDHGFDDLVGITSPPIRATAELTPVAITTLPSGRQVVDFGQNIQGWIRLSNLGPAGTVSTIIHTELLTPEGDVTQDYFGSLNALGHELGQIDEVTSAGREGDVFEARHSTKGFQYVGIDGHPGGIGPGDITAVHVQTDFATRGSFECSDARINRLHEVSDWSFRGNALDFPTDCPTRERQGWTGDWQLYFPTAAFLHDVAGFSTKWLHDLAADQWADGRVPNYIPDPHGEERARSIPLVTFITGSAGWIDAAAIVPWEQYLAYGDERILEEQFDSMMAMVDFAARQAREHRHPSRVAAHPVARPHEEFIWDGTFHFGEWLEPDSAQELGELFRLGIDLGAVGTAFLYRSSDIVARVAGLLGRKPEERKYADLAAKALAAWRTEFIGEDGSLTPDKQANHVRALDFGLVPEDLRGQTASRLVALIREAGNHLGTGFLSTPDLMPVLHDHGHTDVAFTLLYQDTTPSWLGMIDKGATTIWEVWEAIDDDGVGHESLNHYSKGAVITFLHTRVGGIQLLEPGYRRFRIAPTPGGGLTWATTTHESPYGLIESKWRVEEGTFHLDVTVPAGTTAEIVLPDGATATVAAGHHSYTARV